MSDSITVQLTFYGPAAALAGQRTLALEVAAGATVGVLLEALAMQRPALAPLLPRCATALNGSLVPPGSLLADGDRLDLLPPVSGG
jgi:molybdopterin converting factor small subunit